MRAFLILALLLSACPPSLTGSDDDDATSDDDDASDDDEASDDDDASDDASDDDDDAVSTDCPAAVLEALNSGDAWTAQWSCADAFFSVGSPDQTERLAFFFNLTNGPPIEAGATFALVYDDFDPKNAVGGSTSLQTGSNLFVYDCNDAFEEKPRIEYELYAVEGSVLLSVDEYFEEKWWTGSVRISGLVVEGYGVGRCEVPDNEWTELSFGWLPG